MFKNILHTNTPLFTSQKIPVDLYPGLSRLIPESENNLIFVS